MNPITLEIIIFLIVKIELKNESYKLFFKEDGLIACKTTLHNFFIASPNTMN